MEYHTPWDRAGDGGAAGRLAALLSRPGLLCTVPGRAVWECDALLRPAGLRQQPDVKDRNTGWLVRHVATRPGTVEALHGRPRVPVPERDCGRARDLQPVPGARREPRRCPFLRIARRGPGRSLRERVGDR